VIISWFVFQFSKCIILFKASQHFRKFCAGYASYSSRQNFLNAL